MPLSTVLKVVKSMKKTSKKDDDVDHRQHVDPGALTHPAARASNFTTPSPRW